jgi:hypothetical protein
LLLLLLLRQELLMVGLQDLLLCTRLVPASYGGALGTQLAAVCGLQAPASRHTQQKQKQQHAACVIPTCGMNGPLQARCRTRLMLLT